MAEQREPVAALTPQLAALALTVGVAAGVAFVLLPYGAVWLYAVATSAAPPNSPLTSVSGFGSSLTMLFPAVQGFAMALALGKARYGVVPVALLVLALLVVELVCAAVFMREGVICLIILAPMIYTLMIIGALLGRWLARRNAGAVFHASLIPLVALAVFAEATGPKPNYASSVADSVVIDAPPEYVWRYVLQYPENQTASEYWLWNIGLPRPIQSVVEAPRVGATRLCRFSDGIVFEERITELEPNRVMTFEVTRQPNHPEVIGHFQFDRGQIRLTDNGDGTTTITATSWYRLFVRPAVYFDWWTADITRNIHFRVLNHMKRLAEQDYANDRAADATDPT